MDIESLMIKQNNLLEGLLGATKGNRPNAAQFGAAYRGQPIQSKHTFVDSPPNLTTTDYRPLYDADGIYGGFFQDCSLEDGLLNLMIHPIQGIANAIPVVPNNNVDHSWGFLTRYDIDDDPAGVERTSACGPCIPIESTLDFCKMSVPYGCFCRSIHTMDITQLILRSCQNQYDQFYVVGTWRGVSDNIPFGSIGSDTELIKALAVNRKMYELGQVLQRWLLRNVWVGDPAANPTPPGGTMPGNFFGLMRLINGDYPTSGLPLNCASGTLADTKGLNSIVVNAAGACVGDGTFNLFHTLEEIEQDLYMRASLTGMLPVQWRIYMISPLWRELTKYLPCEMVMEGCSGITRTLEVNSQSGSGLDFATIQARQQMQQNMTIELNGRTYPVYIDDTMPYVLTNSAGKFKYASSLMFIPFSVAGGVQSLYWEHIDYSQIYKELTAFNGSDKWTGFTDNGYYWHNVLQQRNCIDLTTEMCVRLIFKTPQLAARIDNLGACADRKALMYFDGAGKPTGALSN